MSKEKFKLLQADLIDHDAMYANDAWSAVRRLEKNPEIAELRTLLAAQPELVKDLCAFVNEMIAIPHSPRYRHPNQTAIAAGLLVLNDDEGPEAAALFKAVMESTDITLAWTLNVAEAMKDIKSKDQGKKLP